MGTPSLGLGPFLEKLDKRLSTLGPDQVRQALLEHAKGVAAIVEAQHRGAYQHAAALAVAWAEAATFASGAQTGNDYVAAWEPAMLGLVERSWHVI